MVRQVRSFNRTVTQRIGVLNDAFLARDRPLGQARLLWEIGPGGSDVRVLRSRLDLDSGYLSRLLRAWRRTDWPSSSRAGPTGGWHRPAHGRGTRRAGRARSAFRRGGRRPPRPAQHVPAGPPGRGDGRSRAAADRLGDPDRRAGSAHPDARFCLQAYFGDSRPLRRRLRPGPQPDHGPGDDPACGPVPARHAARRARRLRRDQVPRRRPRLHQADVGVARRPRPGPRPPPAGRAGGPRKARHAPAVQLETNQVLGEAIALYRSAGYREVPAFNDEPYAHHWFEKALA